MAGEPVRRGLAALLHRPPSASTGSAWVTTLEQVVADLENLNRSTERDFLAVGEKLMEFRSEGRQIAADIAALNDLISGEHGRHASGALARILENFREMDAQIAGSGQALEGVRDHSRRIRLAFSGLPNTVSVFRTLCTLTRIETSRLGGRGAGFSDLADEVAPLSASIQSTGEGVLEAASRLDRSVQSAVRSGSGIRARELREMPALISGVTGSMAAFKERQRKARDASVSQAGRNREVCEAIDHLVESIQFHDITRQQIEHVAQALAELGTGFHGGRAGGDTAPPEARAVLTLQSSQLSSAERAFASSIGRIERDLESIAVRVRAMAEDVRSLMGMTEDDQSSFFLQMEASFTAILDGLEASTAAQAEMRSTAAGLEETIAGMRQSVEQIRGVEIQIQRIAINATIRAAHLGDAGSALDVIAGEMQRLAFDSNRNTEDVAGALDAMSEAARRASAGSRTEASDPVGEMRAALLELHSSSESSFSRISQIATLGSRLAEDIGAVRSGFSAGRLFAGVVDRARGELERVGAASLEDGETAPTGGLEHFAKHYTMQMEREVHERVASGAAISSSEPAEAAPTVAEDGLGDNVELF
ncbi:hypothetical protein SBA4_2270013 [Candidatus Sulfopaludibacter sp. SbA4]|nr:hypothetical protein SBA4_2270013 [Candidatus Sulfopaludibacter sp. SbA4]